MLLVISGRHTHTQRKERKNGPSPVFFCLICEVCRHSSGDYGECSCPWGWESRAEEARLRAVPYFSFESRGSRARHSACEGRGTMAEAQVKKIISSLRPHLSSFLPLICTLSLFRSLRLAGKKDDRSRGQEEGGQNNLNPSHTGNLYPSSQVRNQSRN